MDENTQIFISESEELLEDMEQALLSLERAPNDVDLINRIFRAAHTIKGSSGLFGFDSIVSFTHVVENLLDDVRNCLVPVSNALVSLLMQCKDHIQLLVGDIVVGKKGTIEENYPEQQSLIEMLSAYQLSQEQPVGIPEEKLKDASVNQDSKQAETSSYHVSIRMSPDTFREGFDPTMMFSELSELGTIENCKIITSNIPELSNIEAEACYLGWELSLSTSADKQAIAEIFEWYEDSDIRILPPKSKIEEYQQLIEELPEEEAALGQILLEIGSLTAAELQQTLNKQKDDGGFTGDLLIDEGKVQPEIVEIALKKQQKVRVEKQKERGFVRVAADKLDQLVTLVGELVMNGAKLSQLSNERQDVELAECVDEMTHTLENMRETALGMRMMPLTSTFNKFHRVVRDTADELGKKIRLRIVGAETELDKTVIERIADPLTHLIRNALDHGMEIPAERRKVGKVEEGIITLSASHAAGSILIEVEDDGRGLNADKILSIAKEKGLVSANHDLSDEQVYRLIFEAGFSTADAINNLSGRGVGMDVVRRNIESLRGTVNIASTLGEGTKISIRLPLTLAIIDGFQVRVGEGDFIIPLESMVECISLSDSQKDESSKHDFIRLREEMLPLIHLSRYWEIPQEIDLLKNSRVNLVVVQFNEAKIGILVDSLHGEVQAVIKPLGRVFKGVQGFAGFTLLGSGNVALIMDIAELVKSVVSNEQKQQQQIENKTRKKTLREKI